MSSELDLQFLVLLGPFRYSRLKSPHLKKEKLIHIYNPGSGEKDNVQMQKR